MDFEDLNDIDYDRPAVIPDEEAVALDRAEWDAYMIRKITAARDDTVARYKAEINRLGEAMAERRAIENNKIAWHEERIRQVHQMLDREQKGVPTIHFPHGTSKLRTPKTPKVVEPDPNDVTVLMWLHEHHPDVLKMPNVSTIRDLVAVVTDEDGHYHVIDKSTGEDITGILTAALDDPTWNFKPETGDPL